MYVAKNNLFTGSPGEKKPEEINFKSLRFDEVEVRESILLRHKLAEGLKGLFVVIALSGERGKPPIWTGHFPVGDSERMIQQIMSFCPSSGLWGIQNPGCPANVYSSWALFRDDLPAGKKGRESDVLFSLAAVLDVDNDKRASEPFPIDPTFRMETSDGNFQEIFAYSNPLTGEIAKPVCRAANAFSGQDSAEKDISHIWRIPGTLNWPTPEKIKRGRSAIPFLVRSREASGLPIDHVNILALAPNESSWIEKRETLSGPPDSAEKEKLIEALKLLCPDKLPRVNPPPSPYDFWLWVGMAIHSFDPSEGGKKLWAIWSKRSKDFNEDEIDKKWDSFREGEVTVASIYAWSKGEGFSYQSKFTPSDEMDFALDLIGPPPLAADSPKAEKKKLSEVNQLLLLGHEPGVTLFHDGATGYISILRGATRETMALKSQAAKMWLRAAYFRVSRTSASQETLSRAMQTFEAEALVDGPQQRVWLRVGEGDNGKFYIDLGTPEWDAIEIDPEGWRIVETPPIYFKRPPEYSPLVRPVHGGSIERLRSLLNIASSYDGQGGKPPRDFVLAVSWLLTALNPRGPYPICGISGEAGSAKSSFVRILRSFIDPNPVPLRAVPKTERDLAIAAHNSYCLAFDNMSYLSEDLSNAMCQMSTGGGFATRELFTDSSEMLFKESRPQILNGLSDVSNRPDLADRAILITLSKIPEEARLEEREMEARLAREAPGIFGALLDGISTGLRRFDSVILPRKPRMADFAHWGGSL